MRLSSSRSTTLSTRSITRTTVRIGRISTTSTTRICQTTTHGQVNNQEATNARNLKFANARSEAHGRIGWAVDSSTQLQKDYTNALLPASQAATSTLPALEQSDINAKNQLIGLAQQGNFTGAVPECHICGAGRILGRGAELRFSERLEQSVPRHAGYLSE